MTEILDGTGAPRHFGFLRCIRCGCWRKGGVTVRVLEGGVLEVRCTDEAFCSLVAGVGLGKLDATP